MLQPFAKPLGQLILLSCLAAGAWPVGAQTANRSNLPDVLRDMPLAGQMCRNDRQADSTADIALGDHPVDMGCALAATGVATYLQKPGAVVVDTRQELQFAQFHLASAMRMDVASIRLKPYLKDKPLLLVGDGKGERELYAACSTLKTQGFRTVQVLHGGMPAYLTRDLPVVGTNVPAVIDLGSLDAGELWAESHFEHNLVLILESPKMAELLKGRATAVAGGSQPLATAVERRRRDAKTPIASVLLVTAAALSNASFEEYVRAVAPLPLLVYGQGPEPLAKFLKSQEAVWATYARGPRQPRCG